MATYLFCSSAWYGRVNPTLPMAQELVARGHDVIFYCSDKFKGDIEATGATFRPYKSARGVPGSFLSSDPVINECHFVLEQILNDVRAEHIDMVVYEDMCLWAKILAQLIKVPAAIIKISYAGNQEFTMVDYHNKTFNTRTPDVVVTPERIDAIASLCKKFRLDLFPVRSIYTLAEPLALVLMPRVFHPQEEVFDEAQFKFIGPSIRQVPRATEFPYEVLERKPILYASLGTVSNSGASVFDTFLSAFGNQAYHMILALGKNVKPEVFGPLPDNVTLQSYAPQLDILAQTDIFITHGGMNSVMEALSYGVPLVVAPQSPEQAITAHRVAEMKVGVMVAEKAITVHTLRQAVEQVRNNPEIRLNAQRMREIIKEAGGYMRATDEIERYNASVSARGNQQLSPHA